MPLKKLPGARVPHRKNTAGCKPERIPRPEQVVIPMSMHIGTPSKVLVKPGDEVKVGQPIAESGGFISAPTHASVAGKVMKIDTVLLSNGQYMTAVVINKRSKGRVRAYKAKKKKELEAKQAQEGGAAVK